MVPATVHIAKAMMDVLQQLLVNHIISWNGHGIQNPQI
jgi:hypothetical protein